MNIYIETNFVLELAFEQEQCVSCEQVLQLCEAEQARLIIPAYCLAEPHEKLSRQANKRRELQQSLDAELRQISRTASYTNRLQSIREIKSLIVQSNEEERNRFNQNRSRLLTIAEVVPLTTEILIDAASCETTYALRPQDAIVYASVICHLRQHQPPRSCFLNRNSKDFDSPDIIHELNQLNCRMIPRFDHGYRFLKSQLQ